MWASSITVEHWENEAQKDIRGEMETGSSFGCYMGVVSTGLFG